MRKVVGQVKQLDQVTVEPTRRGSRPRTGLKLTIGSTEASLDPAKRRYDVWARYLGSRLASGKPVYVEIESGRVTRILPPELAQIVGPPTKDPDSRSRSLRVRVTTSCRFLTLPPRHPRHPDYDDHRDLLLKHQQSGEKLLITSDPVNRQILDLRPPEDPAGHRHQAGASWPREPDIKVLTKQQADDEFRFLALQSHIPFDFPDDGCPMRAHEMCRLLKVRNFQWGAALFRRGQTKESRAHEAIIAVG